MKGNEIRRRFIDYFIGKNHSRIDSSSLVPHDDPTLLFTNAGMVQFKKVFMGEEKSACKRAVTVQRCVRAGGKHNDLENVGYTARHHTFFEMLGNFSFGDYFKEDAIRYAWDFLLLELGINPERLWVSVFDDDDEAWQIWEQVDGLLPGRIVRMGEKDNFWSMGDTGPCGPCSEIHYDQGVEFGCDRPDCGLGCDCDRFLELWNLVFMQFNRDEAGKLHPLPRPSIDTGMGLERVASVLQGKQNNYDADLFYDIIDYISELSGRKYKGNHGDTVAMRVIADHARATAFLVADGVLPANEGRGYVLRRIMRRAIRFGRNLGLDNFFSGVCLEVIDVMGEAWPHLQDSAELLAKVVANEELRFGETLDKGLAMLEAEIERLRSAEGEKGCISGEFIFRLYDTYGFPVDIIRDMSIEAGVDFDEKGFTRFMEQQKEQSRKARKGQGVTQLDAGLKRLVENGIKSEFVGYQRGVAQADILGIVDEHGNLVDSGVVGKEYKIVCSRTPFYAESGGQVSDAGVITGPGEALFKVSDIFSPVDGLIVHQGRVEKGGFSVAQEVRLQIEDEKRRKTAANHTATHLLHSALKEVLGDHVKQAGSLVSDGRLRFDFTHFSPLSREEKSKIEKIVNREIIANHKVVTEVLSHDEALAAGATALFGEKYGEEVRVVSVAGFSKELCGGTHVAATGDIGLFRISMESGIAAGVRRLEAVTGMDALSAVQEIDLLVDEVAGKLSVPVREIAAKVEHMLARQKEMEKELASLAASRAAFGLDELLSSAVEVDGVKVVTGLVPLIDSKTLREVGDKLRAMMGSGVAVIGGEINGKAALLALVSKDLSKTIHAGKLVGRVAEVVGGRGGGRPDMAQAGGAMPDKLKEAMAEVKDIVAEMISEAGK